MQKVRIKTSAFEVEIEASEGLVAEDIQSVISLVRDAYDSVPTLASTRPVQEVSRVQPTASAKREGTINTVVAKLGGDSCRALLHAAAIHMVAFQGKDRLPRADLISLAKTANAWSKAYNSNAARDIARMVANSELIENEANIYSVPERVLAEAVAKIGDVG